MKQPERIPAPVAAAAACWPPSALGHAPALGPGASSNTRREAASLRVGVVGRSARVARHRPSLLDCLALALARWSPLSMVAAFRCCSAVSCCGEQHPALPRLPRPLPPREPVEDGRPALGAAACPWRSSSSRRGAAPNDVQRRQGADALALQRLRGRRRRAAGVRAVYTHRTQPRAPSLPCQRLPRCQRLL